MCETWPCHWEKFDPAELPTGEPIIDVARKLLEDIEQVVRYTLEGRQNDTRPDICRRISVGFSPQFTLTGLATRTQRGYAIALDGGAPFQLLDTFGKLLSYGRAMPSIGVIPPSYTTLPPLTRFNRIPLNLDIDFAGDIPLLTHLTDGDGESLDWGSDARTDALRQLIVFGMQFLFFHELAHVLYRHVDYLSVVPAIEHQRTMEHLADRYAIQLAAGYQMECIPILAHQKGWPEQQAAAYLYQLWGFAVTVVFLLLETFYDTGTQGQESCYPPASHRSLLVQAAAMIDVATHAPENMGHILRSSYKAGTDEAFRSWTANAWPKYRAPSMEEIDATILACQKLDIWLLDYPEGLSIGCSRL